MMNNYTLQELALIEKLADTGIYLQQHKRAKWSWCAPSDRLFSQEDCVSWSAAAIAALETINDRYLDDLLADVIYTQELRKLLKRAASC